MLDKLNGYKTYLGIFGLFVLGGIAALHPEMADAAWYSMAHDFSQTLLLVGAAHKVDKLIVKK